MEVFVLYLTAAARLDIHSCPLALHSRTDIFVGHKKDRTPDDFAHDDGGKAFVERPDTFVS